LRASEATTDRQQPASNSKQLHGFPGNLTGIETSFNAINNKSQWYGGIYLKQKSLVVVFGACARHPVAALALLDDQNKPYFKFSRMSR
jgi:hypothetical protein